jgi:hypothetical protein
MEQFVTAYTFVEFYGRGERERESWNVTVP